jgi:methyl-accepting chemotaxis protein
MMFEIMALCCLTVTIFSLTGLIVFAHYLGYINGNPDLWENVSQIMEYAWSNYAIFILLVTLAILYISGALAILVTHQIAGPVYRFLNILEKLEKGDFSEDFKLRKGDHLQQVAEKIRLMMKSNVSNISLIRTAISEMENESITSPVAREKLKVICEIAESYILPGDPIPEPINEMEPTNPETISNPSERLSENPDQN